MRYALIGDVHANLPALEAVLAHLAGGGGADPEADLDGVYHLGDLVGYAPWPNEVVRLLAEREIAGVAGNYDSTVAHGHEHCGCRYEDPGEAELSHLSYSWTRRHVSNETRRRLRALPFALEVRVGGGHASGPTLHLFHGAPTLNTLYWHADRDDDFCLRMAERVGAHPGDVLAFGHTHVPWHREVEGIHFVNAGSVGRPKDGDARACVAVVEMGSEPQHSLELSGGGALDGEAQGDPSGGDAHRAPAGGDARGARDGEDARRAGDGGSGGGDVSGPVRVEFLRVEYDVDRAVRGIEESDLPDEFGRILQTGGSL